MTPDSAVRIEGLPIPAPVDAEMAWWSDAFAELLRRFDIPYMSLNPGASFRGLHDSLINHLGNQQPAMILCLHEEHAVAVAHGYAKVTQQPMLVAVHTNVGLMHATMAIFNAFCDRVPMLILGATGPLAADRRRPWIEWIHTSADLGALVRNFVKWDDQPASGPATLESLTRANALTRTKPHAPVFVCLDQEVQEAALGGRTPALPDPARHPPTPPAGPQPEQVQQIVKLLSQAERPLILAGRVGRDPGDWQQRVALAEALGAAVLTDLRVAAAFPSHHPLNPAVPGSFLTPSGGELVRSADVLLSLDWVDLGGTLHQAYNGEPVAAQIVSCSVDHVLANGWSKDQGELAPVDVTVGADPDLLVRALAARLAAGRPAARSGWPPARPSPPAEPAAGGAIDVRGLAVAFYRALEGVPACVARLSIGWPGEIFQARGPLDYLGLDGGGGVGSGPGMVVGTALALADSPRLVAAVLGDGDFLMGNQALWTAARYELPMLVVVANNGSFGNDEMHQERMAIARGRPVENRAVGIQIQGPYPNLTELAHSLGLRACGPVEAAADLPGTLEQAVAAARGGAAVVVDVRIGAPGHPGEPAPSHPAIQAIGR